jgi:hypothetical protein
LTVRLGDRACASAPSGQGPSSPALLHPGNNDSKARIRTVAAMRWAGAGEQASKALRSLRWLPALCWQRLARRLPSKSPLHLILAVADHFEPSFVPGPPGKYASWEEQERRVEQWCRTYPASVMSYRDADGRPLRHTYFFPAEQYDKGIIQRLADHCRTGWGEIEIHLHHGIHEPDTPENTRGTLIEFRDALVRHGCLSTWDGQGPPRYAFVHGNWALANSFGGRYCGVDDEMQILAETGCYADFTLPSAPHPAQVRKINSVYECALPLDRRAPHRRGRDLRRERPPKIFPLIVQGPLALSVGRRPGRWPTPRIENGELSHACPPTLGRLSVWRRAAITIKGRPDWLFIKLHCHGMDPRDKAALSGSVMQRFLRELSETTSSGGEIVHFVTAREMVNILLAACDGRDGTPGDFRDYRLRLTGSACRA